MFIQRNARKTPSSDTHNIQKQTGGKQTVAIKRRSKFAQNYRDKKMEMRNKNTLVINSVIIIIFFNFYNHCLSLPSR